MDGIELVKQNIDVICRLGVAVSIENAKGLVDELERMETVMPILDPTEWMRVSKTIKGHKTAAIAFLRFRMALETVKEGSN